MMDQHHFYHGDCPDDTQPDARDPKCPACRDMDDIARLRASLTDAHAAIHKGIEANVALQGEVEALREANAMLDRRYREQTGGRNLIVELERDRLRAEVEALREALQNTVASAIPGMNWTDETGQLILAQAKAALAAGREHGIV